MKKYFVVSDVHDHYDLMMEALTGNGFDRNDKNHVLILCGDAFYSGPQPGEMFMFLRSMHNEGRLILIYGNHDIELLDNLKTGKFGRKGNRRCAELLVNTMTGKNNLTDADLVSECERLGFTGFLENVPIWFYETDQYVFTHAFIPTKKKAYRSDWRAANEREWRTAASSDAMRLSMRYGICEPDKTIVCGHFSAARFYLMKDATASDWENKIYKDVSKVPAEGFKPFFRNGIIAIDQSVKKTGFINCIVI